MSNYTIWRFQAYFDDKTAQVYKSPDTVGESVNSLATRKREKSTKLKVSWIIIAQALVEGDRSLRQHRLRLWW